MNMSGAAPPPAPLKPNQDTRRAARRTISGLDAVKAKLVEGKKAFGSFTFVLYFFFIVVAIGGLGVWIPIVGGSLGLIDAGWREVVREVGTCVMAIVCSGAADLLLTDREAKSVKFTAVCLMLLCFATLVGTYLPKEWVAVLAAIIGGPLALFSWVLANADNSKLSDDEPPPEDYLGGATDKVAGSTQGVKV